MYCYFIEEYEKNEPKLNIPNNAIDAIEECPNVIFPNIRLILIIVATLPISVASAERSFSTLRR